MPRIQKAHYSALAVAFLSVPVLWSSLYLFSYMAAEIISKLVGITKMDYFLVVDSITSLVVMFMFFLSILLVMKVHARFVVWFCAVSMFLFWGFESDFFWEGLHPMYPVWYEIIIALGGFVTAALAIFVQGCIARSTTKFASTTGHAE